jgi:hypothetical protein
LLAIISAGIIYFRIRAIGRLSLVIAAVSGLIIFLLAVMLYKEPDEILLDDKD